MGTRDIHYQLIKQGQERAAVRITLWLISDGATLPDDSAIPLWEVIDHTDQLGEATITADVPDTGEWYYSCQVADDEAIVFPLEAGSTIEWADIVEAYPPPPDIPTRYIPRVDPATEGNMVLLTTDGELVDGGPPGGGGGSGATEFTTDSASGPSAVHVVGSTAHDALGISAVDLQQVRFDPSQAATGAFAGIGPGGGGKTAAGYGSGVGAGGEANSTPGNYAGVGDGGVENTASGFLSGVMPGSRQAKPTHNGAKLSTDQLAADFPSITDDEFAVRARGGVRLVTRTDVDGNPTATLTIDGTDGVPASYDGEATTAEIVAMNPTDHIGESWWSTDDHIKISAFSSPITGADEWQAIGVVYDALTDTYQLPTTLDGQTQNIGREIFRTGINDNGTTATALNPKVFLANLVSGTNPSFLSFVKAIASDISHNAIFGLNTTDAEVGGEFKLATFGRLNGVNTSAWPSGTKLYADATTRGEMTDTPPLINAWQVAEVLVQDTVDGVLSVNTINATDLADTGSQVLQGVNVWFTGDETTLTGGTFYDSLIEDQGTVADASQTQTVGDDEMLPLAQDWVSVVNTSLSPLAPGSRSMKMEYQISSTGAGEKLHCEIYVADPDGNVVDSGIVGNPVGARGVRVLMDLESPVLNTPETNDTYFAELTTYLDEAYTIPDGYRLRFTILVEKIGTQGGGKTFTINFGNEHDTRVIGLAGISSDDVSNASTVAGDTVTEALDALNAGGGGGGDMQSDGSVPMTGTLVLDPGADDSAKLWTIPVTNADGADINFNVAKTNFSGVDDTTFNLGFYNSGSGPAGATKHAWYSQWEYKYQNNGENWVEYHLNLFPPNEPGIRPFEYKYNIDGTSGTIFSKATGIQWQSMNGNAVLSAGLGATAAESSVTVTGAFRVSAPSIENAFLLYSGANLHFRVDGNLGSIEFRGSLINFMNLSSVSSLRLSENGTWQVLSASYNGAAVNIQSQPNSRGIAIQQSASSAKAFMIFQNNAGAELAQLDATDAGLVYWGAGRVISSAGNMEIKATGGYVQLTSSKATTGDPSGIEGLIYTNTVDNAIRMYADGAWRDLATW